MFEIFGESKMYAVFLSAATSTPPTIHSHFEAVGPVNLHCAASMRLCICPRTNNRGHGLAIFRSSAIARKERRSPAPLWGNATCRISRSQETAAHESQPPTRGGGYVRNYFCMKASFHCAPRRCRKIYPQKHGTALAARAGLWRDERGG